ncbi:hypothetical protein SFUMM280S_03941 [Streptomyces fumanus]
MTDLARFSINQMTVKQLTLPDLAAACRDLGVINVGLWREPVQEYGVAAAAKLVRDAGLTVTTLCRGGSLTATDPEARAAALADNRRAVDEAAALGTDTLVLVSGGLPPGERSLAAARERIADALAELAPYAGEHGVRLAIEPLHPMYAADRCVVSTLRRPWTSPNASPPTRSASPSTRTTSGGTTGRPRRSPGRARAAASTPSSSPTGPPPCPRASSTAGASSATARSTCASGRAMSRRPATPARSRSSCSTRRCGPATAGRCWPRRPTGS